MAESVAERIRREQAAAVRVFDRVFAERVATISKHNAQQIKELRAQVAALKRILLSETRLESGDYKYKSAEGIERPCPVLSSFDIAGIAEHITSDCKNIIVMCGAGISVSAGIPDFRSKGTGLYDNLEKYNLPTPTAVFDISYFRDNPAAFYMLAQEMWPDKHNPTPTHHFIAELHARGKLLRCYTQNIDSLETRAGLPADKIVAAHGNFDTCSTIGELGDDGNVIPGTKKVVDVEEVRKAIENGDHTETGWPALRAKYSQLVKPDITFFGERLPQRFFDQRLSDFAKCDLLIVMGTALQVAPFCDLVKFVGPLVPRLLINRSPVGGPSGDLIAAGLCETDSMALDYREGVNKRDALYEGECDAGVRELAKALGWADALEERVRKSVRAADKPQANPPPPKRQRTSAERGLGLPDVH